MNHKTEFLDWQLENDSDIKIYKKKIDDLLKRKERYWDSLNSDEKITEIEYIHNLKNKQRLERLRNLEKETAITQFGSEDIPVGWVFTKYPSPHYIPSATVCFDCGYLKSGCVCDNPFRYFN